MQKELEMTNDVIAELQRQVNESNECLEKRKEMIQVLQVIQQSLFYKYKSAFVFLFSFTVEFWQMIWDSAFTSTLYYLWLSEVQDSKL